MRFTALLGLLTLASLTFPASLLRAQSPLHVFHGDSPGDEFGVAVTLVGDANRDGYADVLVGAHWDDNNGSNSGSARLFSGRDGAVLSTVFGDASNDFFGLAVADLGDVDGDGYDDFAVGADGSNFGGVDSGLVRVFSGKTFSILRNITGTLPGEKIGSTLASVHDSSGLILIGAPATDRAHVVLAITGATVWTFFPGVTGDQFGAAVATGRDLNGDGVSDYAIGAPNDDFGAVDSGSVTIFSGATGNQIRVLHGLAAGDRFGSSVALLPDADGDGRGELVVGSPRADGPGSDAGAVYVYSGASGSLIYSRAGEASGDQFGTSVASLATLQGNPEPVFAVGARWKVVGGNNAGAAYVYSAMSGAQLRVLRGNAPGEWFGGALAGGGDVDGNGIGDFVVSARLADVNGLDSGSVELHASPVLPKTWYVDAAAAGPGDGTLGNPYRSIQFAINRSTTRSGDTVLVQPGTYFENLDFVGKSIALVGNGGAGAVVIDGQYLDHCIRITSGESIATRLQSLTMVHGDGNALGDYQGGAVFSTARAQIVDCVFDSNQADYGGAVSTVGDLVRCTFTNNGTSLQGTRGGAVSNARDIMDCIFRGNVAHESGGALWGSFNVISRCVFENNSADGPGGAIAGSFVELRNSLISHNRSNDDAGGGIYVTGPCAALNCSISFNVTGVNDYPGGGVYVDTFYPNASLVATGCVIEGNIAAGAGGAFGGSYYDCVFKQNRVSADGHFPHGSGGGLHSGYAERCVFQGNDARGDSQFSYGGMGGAAFSSTLVNCTLVSNSALNDGGGAFDCSLVNSILRTNVPNSVAGLSTASYSNVQGGWPGIGNISGDPLFIGASVGDVHLTSLSPCIDAGDPSSPLDPDGSRADMGAFPYDPNYWPPPSTYCTAKTNSAGCAPTIGWMGTPTVSGPVDDFHVTASNVLNRKPGLMIWSTQPGSIPFGGGTLCLSQPVVRTTGQLSGGTPAPAIDCTGQYSFHFGHAYIQTYFLAAGQTIRAQYWSRDPGFVAPNDIGLTNGLAFVIGP